MRQVPLPLVPRWLRWAAVLTVAGVVFYFSVIAVPPEQPVVRPPQPDLIPLDKWRHFLAYAAVGGSLAYATTDWEWQSHRLALFVLGVVIVYGAGIELIQSGLPQRYFSVGDAYANALGGLLATPWYLLRSRLTYVRIGLPIGRD